MDKGTLTVYSASAGSGKTFRLAGIYLAHLFRSRYNYRKILAVTFTNKATAEMKSRILDQLSRLASGKTSDYLADLMKDTGKTEEKIRAEAGEILFLILHDFSRFSVCTIDAFFQRVIRSFARETGLHYGFNIEIDHTVLLSDAVEETLASASESAELRDWLNAYVLNNLEEEKSWNLKDSIISLSNELFREKFKLLSADETEHLGSKEFLLNYISRIKSIKSAFESHLSKLAKDALAMFDQFDLSDEMFYYKSRGIPGYLSDLASGNIIEPGSYVRKIEEDPPKWCTGKMDPKLSAALSCGLEDLIREILAYNDRNILNYRSADAILENIYALGILSDVLKNVHELATSENSFLLSDAGELLSLITEGDQTPFIYEKIGNSFENYMIDEFQDTSVLQWKNFFPLIDNSMGEGHDNLVVGDIKQSIYRFRNSDWHILQEMLKEPDDSSRVLVRSLSKNWRSRSGIIRFNNSLFRTLPEIIDSSSGFGVQGRLAEIYSGAMQDDPGKRPGGYVRIEFVEEDQASEDGSQGYSPVIKKWKEKVVDRIPLLIESIQDKGYPASDIGILVRTSSEGAAIVERMIDYSKTGSERYNYNIVSNDSLVLSNSHAITFIIAIMKVLDDPSDMISRAEAVRFFHLAIGHPDAESVNIFKESLPDFSGTGLPSETGAFLEKIKSMPIFEAAEGIISFFGLGKHSWNVSYLNTFQDMVLNFSSTGRNDIRSFLDWWESSGSSKSVVLPPDQDAVKVFTIHKSKGLEFPVVIVPFISWNTDHDPKKKQILWARPAPEPFNELGILPLRYSAKLRDTVFADDYLEEKWSACLDNVNLLYVAMTRAVDILFGFAPEKSNPSGIAKFLKEAILSDQDKAGEKGIALSQYYDESGRIFEYGILPERQHTELRSREIISGEYSVSRKPGSLRLKLHGENYFSSGGEERRRKINYGKLMHEVFENIDSINDIESAVAGLCMEGKLTDSEGPLLVQQIISHLADSKAAEWFKPGRQVLKENEILLPSGVTRRPDRIIIEEGKAIIIDFKFGEEKAHYLNQVGEYRYLLSKMGYLDIEAYIWYVEKDKIVKA